MGGPVSVTFAGCFMNKVEREVVIPISPKFYKRYVDDIYTRRKKAHPDELFNSLNTFHPNLKFTIEENPSKFLDTEITRTGNDLTFMVVPKQTKLPFH